MVSLTMIVGFMVMIQGFFPTPVGADVYTNLGVMASIIASFFTFSGALQLFRYNIPAVTRKDHHWPVNAWAMFCALIMFLLCLIYGGTTHPFIDLILYRGTIRVVATTMTAAQAWICVGVLLRYTGFRNIEVAAFVLSILAVVINLTPLLSVVLPPVYSLASWSRINVGGPASTVYQAGMALGAIVVCVRILMGMERGFLGRAD